MAKKQASKPKDWSNSELLAAYLEERTGCAFKIRPALHKDPDCEVRDVDLELAGKFDWDHLNKAFERIGFRFVGSFLYERGVEGETWYNSASAIAVDVFHPQEHLGQKQIDELEEPELAEDELVGSDY